ncbi:HAD-IIB family hydrolase [Spiroplasma endosymbiont of Stenodema calcarata]|uniref:HAD-IIB family hydrolase n=1 Tax=Spiroplasma endosymbiont of Stenodema calcarata TaxID=3139328 RepID=UPI003CCB5D06
MLKINNNEIKLIVTDVDGTLINDQQELQPIVQNKLISLQKQGVYVSIASGRMPLGFDDYTTALKIKDYSQYVIGANGSLVYDARNNKVVRSNLMSIDDVHIVVAVLLKYECEFTISYENDDSLYCVGSNLLKLKSKAGAFLDGMKRAKPFQFNEIKCTNKIVAKHSSKIVFQEMYQELRGMERINVEQLSDYGCDIVHSKSNKGQAILHLINILNQTQAANIMVENVLYFGDNYNDRSAFEVLPYAIAMEHTPLAIAQLAFDIMGSNNASGIYHYLNKLEQNN